MNYSGRLSRIIVLLFNMFIIKAEFYHRKAVDGQVFICQTFVWGGMRDELKENFDTVGCVAQAESKILFDMK